jgi:hypothetical protein
MVTYSKFGISSSKGLKLTVTFHSLDKHYSTGGRDYCATLFGKRGGGT